MRRKIIAGLVVLVGIGVAVAWAQVEPVKWNDPEPLIPAVGTGTVALGDGALGMNPDTTFDRLRGSLSDADTARINVEVSTFAGVEYTLMWESVPAGEKGYRLYVTPDGTSVRTVNAKWNNTTNLWAKDVDNEEASRIDQANTGAANKHQISGTNSWVDGSWVDGVRRSVYQPISSFWGTAQYSIGYATINGSDTFRLSLTSGLNNGDIIETVTIRYQANLTGGSQQIGIYASLDSNDLITPFPGDIPAFIQDGSDRTLVHTMTEVITMQPGLEIVFLITLTGTSGDFFLYSVSSDVLG